MSTSKKRATTKTNETNIAVADQEEEEEITQQPDERGHMRPKQELFATAQEALQASLISRNYLKSRVEDADELMKAFESYLEVRESLLRKYEMLTEEELEIRNDMIKLQTAQLRLFLFKATYTHGFHGTTKDFQKGVRATFDDCFSLENVVESTDMVDALQNTLEVEVEMFYSLFWGAVKFEKIHYKNCVALEREWLHMAARVATGPSDEDDEDEDEDEKPKGRFPKLTGLFRRKDRDSL